MKVKLIDPRSAAITSFLLALPFMSFFLLFVLSIEPDPGPFEHLLTSEADQPQLFSASIVLGAVFLLISGFIVDLVSIGQNVRLGISLRAMPINLMIALVLLFFILLFVGGIIIDQYPCWIGVPNCD